MLNEAKARVHIRVVGTEPVTEPGSGEPGGSTGRGAFHYIVLPVEEIGRIARVRGMRCESFKGSKDVTGPLPTVAGHLMGCIASVGPGINRDGIPPLVVEIVSRRVGCLGHG